MIISHTEFLVVFLKLETDVPVMAPFGLMVTGFTVAKFLPDPVHRVPFLLIGQLAHITSIDFINFGDHHEETHMV